MNSLLKLIEICCTKWKDSIADIGKKSPILKYQDQPKSPRHMSAMNWLLLEHKFHHLHSSQLRSEVRYSTPRTLNVMLSTVVLSSFSQGILLPVYLVHCTIWIEQWKRRITFHYNLKPSARQLKLGHNWMYQQDKKNPEHTLKLVVESIRQANIKHMKWPSETLKSKILYVDSLKVRSVVLAKGHLIKCWVCYILTLYV